MDNSKVIIKKVVKFSPELGIALRKLVAQLGSPSSLTDEDIEKMLEQSCTKLFIAERNDIIVGMMTTVFYRIPYRRKGWIEDIVVDVNYRKLGIGAKLLNVAISEAKKDNISSLNLTSDSRHISAHSLYEKLGFTKRATNVFRILL